MQGIADCLKQLGLGQYTQCFAENEIDVTVLRHLTDQDLREIGVPLGHRRKILAAIREDMGSTTPVTSEPVDHLEPTAVPSPALAVPASLYATLMSRLDRLGGPPKEVAQVAAAIGREFSHALLNAVTRKRDVEMGSALDRLIAAGLLFRQGLPPYAAYLFKHALVRD